MFVWWRDLSVSKKLYCVIGIMTLLIATELGALHFAMRTLSAVRAFAGAEGFWSKAEQTAVQYLHLYAITHEEKYYQDFLDQLRIPMGYRAARLELTKPDMNMAVITDGFLQGQNHLHDIEPMVGLVRRFHWVPTFAYSIDKWREGDELITELIKAASQLHLEILKGPGKDLATIKSLIDRISRIDNDLTFVENDFSFRLGEASRWLEGWLMIILLMAVVIVEGTGLIMTITFARGLTKGLGEINQAAAKIGEGDFSPEVPVRSKDELGLLAIALNKMTSNLRHQVCVRQDAEHASETKNLFLANMSHEIRTPLNAILGFSELLADDKLTPRERADYAAIVKRTGAALTAIINDILDIAKVEADRIEIDIEPFSLTQLLSDLKALLVMRCEEKGIQLTIEKKGPVAERILSDPTRLRQILANIIGNAIKFTDSGAVTVSYFVVGSQLEFRVRDSGGGIPEAQKNRLFQPFSQGNSSVRKRYGGTGLGLMISQRLAQLLEGDVGLTDPQPQGGAEFFIRIRYEPADTLSSRLESSNSIRTDVDGLKGQRILVVEDSKDNRLLVELYLSRAGASVSFADNGQVGIEMATTRPFDLILMDMQMPIMDGYAATTELRRRGVKIPIVALTGYAMKKDHERCLVAGCTAYLKKPIDRLQLISCVLAMLEPQASHRPKRLEEGGAVESSASS